MAVSKDVVLAAAILGNGKARGVRAHPEPMDTEGVSFGARFALAGSVVALAWKNAGRSIHKRRALILAGRLSACLGRDL